MYFYPLSRTSGEGLLVCLPTTMSKNEAAIPESEDQAVTVTDANAPFDNPDADVIIRSSDNVDFRVLKLFLSWASPFFGDMFGLPQGPAGSISEEQETRDGIPVIQVTEKSQVMETLLKFCHPNHAPAAFKTVEEILPVMEAAIKYGIEGMERHAREALTTPPLVQENPTLVFAVASQHGWEKEARIAAWHTLRQPPSERWYVSQLETISGGDHYRLQQYYWDCSKAAKEVTTSKTLSMFNGGFVGFNCRSTCKRPEDHCFSANGSFISPNGWWVDYMQQMGDALAQRPCGETVLDPDMLEATLLQIRCQNCCSNSKLVPEMRKFNKQLAEEVERVVSKVTLKVRI